MGATSYAKCIQIFSSLFYQSCHCLARPVAKFLFRGGGHLGKGCDVPELVTTIIIPMITTISVIIIVIIIIIIIIQKRSPRTLSEHLGGETDHSGPSP